MIYLAPLTVAPGRATREVGSLIWGSDTSGRTNLSVLIIEPRLVLGAGAENPCVRPS